jgi:hypothetical protein
VETVELRQGWSVSTRRGREKKKRRRPRKVVCRHKKGTLRRFMKRKRPRKAKRWLRKGKVPCVLDQEISFFGSRVVGFRETRLV